MKKIFAILLLACVFVSGCGTPLIELTTDESQRIISYASYVVMRHNSAADKGVVKLAESADAAPNENANDESPAEEAASPQGESADSESADASQGQTAEASASAGNEGTAVASVSEAADLSGCTIAYSGIEEVSEYTEGTYFSMTPSSGNVYFIVRYTLKNDSSDAVTVNLMDQRPAFTADIDGTSYEAKSTVLSSDLANINNQIESGGTLDTIIMFEVPEGTAQTLNSLQVTVNGKTASLDVQ